MLGKIISLLNFMLLEKCKTFFGFIFRIIFCFARRKMEMGYFGRKKYDKIFPSKINMLPNIEHILFPHSDSFLPLIVTMQFSCTVSPCTVLTVCELAQPMNVSSKSITIFFCFSLKQKWFGWSKMVCF